MQSGTFKIADIPEFSKDTRAIALIYAASTTLVGSIACFESWLVAQSYVHEQGLTIAKNTPNVQ